MYLLQEVIQGTVSIWPQDVLGWFQLFGAVILVVGSTLGGVWGIVNSKFNKLDKAKTSIVDFKKLGEDVEECKAAKSEYKARIEKLEFDQQGNRYKHENLDKEITMVNDSTKNLDRVIRSMADEVSKDIRSISESVARMEGAVSQITGRKRGEQ